MVLGCQILKRLLQRQNGLGQFPEAYGGGAAPPAMLVLVPYFQNQFWDLDFLSIYPYQIPKYRDSTGANHDDFFW